VLREYGTRKLARSNGEEKGSVYSVENGIVVAEQGVDVQFWRPTNEPPEDPIGPRFVPVGLA